MTIVKIGILLERQGVAVPYRTLHRFATERCGSGRGATTVSVADGDPGQACRVDFGKMGLVYDPSASRRRTAHALIFTAVYSRHMFVWWSFTQSLTAVVAGCEAAWRFSGGVFGVLVPENMSAIIAAADPVNLRFAVGWSEYQQARGLVTDAARVRSRRTMPRVERTVPFVRRNFFAGEEFVDLPDSQARVLRWCATTAGLRIHGTTRARPAEVFAEQESPLLLPPAKQRSVVPTWAEVKVHRDFHVQVGKALYSTQKAYVGQTVSAHADAELVKLYHQGQLIETHPRQQPGGLSTDPEDLPAEKVGYAMRDLDRLIKQAGSHGEAIGIYAERLLDDELPWTRMRQAYRLLGLVRRYGPDPANTACERALALDVVIVTKIASMLERATENTAPPPPRATEGIPAARFARDPAEFAPAHPAAQLAAVLRQLKLGEMLDTLGDRLALAKQQQLSHAAFLELVLADEVARRQANSAHLRARAAGLDAGMRLESWDDTAAVRFDHVLWNELTSLRFLDGPHGALILGRVGVGKTHLATAFGNVAVRRRHTTLMGRGQTVQTAQSRPPRQHHRNRDAPPNQHPAADHRRLRAPTTRCHRTPRLLRTRRSPDTAKPAQ